MADNHGFFKTPVVVTHAAPRPTGSVEDLHCTFIIVSTGTAIEEETNWVLKCDGGNCVCVCVCVCACVCVCVCVHVYVCACGLCQKGGITLTSVM